MGIQVLSLMWLRTTVNYQVDQALNHNQRRNVPSHHLLDMAHRDCCINGLHKQILHAIYRTHLHWTIYMVETCMAQQKFSTAVSLWDHNFCCSQNTVQVRLPGKLAFQYLRL